MCDVSHASLSITGASVGHVVITCAGTLLGPVAFHLEDLLDPVDLMDPMDPMDPTDLTDPMVLDLVVVVHLSFNSVPLPVIPISSVGQLLKKVAQPAIVRTS